MHQLLGSHGRVGSNSDRNFLYGMLEGEGPAVQMDGAIGVGSGETVLDVPSDRAAQAGQLHPDLVAASDLVIAKLGYSTVAEVYHAGRSFAYLRRPTFPESPILEAFVEEHIPSAPLPDDWLKSPAGNRIIEDLLGAVRPREDRPNGATQAAGLILGSPHLRF